MARRARPDGRPWVRFAASSVRGFRHHKNPQQMIEELFALPQSKGPERHRQAGRNAATYQVSISGRISRRHSGRR